MKLIRNIALLLLLCGSDALGQGTVVFHNRGLIEPTSGANLNMPVYGGPPGASAQLYLVNDDGTYTPLPGVGGTSGILNLREHPNEMWLDGPILVEVPGVPAGTAGVRVIMRGWLGSSYDSSNIRAQSDLITLGPLGGVPESGAPVIPPTLGGLAAGEGFEGLFFMPEPSTYAMLALGAVVLLFRGRKRESGTT